MNIDDYYKEINNWIDHLMDPKKEGDILDLVKKLENNETTPRILLTKFLHLCINKNQKDRIRLAIRTYNNN